MLFNGKPLMHVSKIRYPSASKPAAVTQGVVTTERLVLTNGPDGVVLFAGPESSLVIETPAGEEVLRIGGRGIR